MDHQNDVANDLIEVRETDGKGLGIFARCDIRQGTRVITESPLIEVDLEGRNASKIVMAFKQLPLQQQEQYLTLHYYASDGFKRSVEEEIGQSWDSIPELDRTVLGIWGTNAYVNVFLLSSRINHSCLPNIQHSWHPGLEQEVFHAVRDITAGEELTVSYLGPLNGDKKRRQGDLDDWGFKCSCPVCEDTPEGMEREKKFAQLYRLENELAFETHIALAESHKRALSVAQKMAAIQKSEGILHRELRVAYHDAGRFCLKLGNRKMACLWAKKELEVGHYCFGEDHPACKEVSEVVELLQATMESNGPLDERIIKWSVLTHRDDMDEVTCSVM